MGETEYEKRIRSLCNDYRELETKELWNELVAVDQHITTYISRRKYSQSKLGIRIERERTTKFFKALEHSRALIRLLKERPKSEIYAIHEYLKSRLYVAPPKGKIEIQSHLSFLEKVFFDSPKR